MITDRAVPNIFMCRNKWILPKRESLAPLDKVLRDVSRRMGLSEDLIKTGIRKRRYVDARRMYFKRAKEKTTASLAEIGELVHNGDHANVAYHINKVDNTPSLSRAYNELFNGAEPYIKPIKEIIPETELTPKKVHLSLTGKPIY